MGYALIADLNTTQELPPTLRGVKAIFLDTKGVLFGPIQVN